MKLLPLLLAARRCPSFVVISLLACVAALSVHGLEPLPDPEITLNHATISPDKGGTFQLIAVMSAENDSAVTWSTSRPSVATVDDNGTVTAVNVGFATITASSQSGATSTCAVLVNAASYVEDFENIVYKTADGVDLRMRVFYPAGWQASDQRPVAVLFHGGSWTGGSYYEMFAPGRYLASRGFVAISAQYRLSSGLAATVVDARSSVRWVKANADLLGIDPEKVIAGGASAGGHLAATCYGGVGIDDPNDDLSISPRPELLLEFDGAVILSGSRYAQVVESFGSDIALGSQPIADGFFKADAPPAIMFYGSEDSYRHWGHAMHDAYHGVGVDSEYWLAAGQVHGFTTNSAEWRQEAFYLADRFLVKHGYLTGEPKVSLPWGEVKMEQIKLGGDASNLIQPASVVLLTGQPGGRGAVSTIGRTIDGSGFSVAPVVLDARQSDADAGLWKTTDGNSAEIVYDLGARADLRQLHLWNYRWQLNNGAHVVENNSPDDVVVSISRDYDPATAVFEEVAAYQPLRGGAAAQNFDLLAEDVRLVKLTVSRAFNPVGIGEVRFSGDYLPWNGETPYMGIGGWDLGADGWVHAADWLGWLWVGFHPWIYSDPLGGFVYFVEEGPLRRPGGAWVYRAGLEASRAMGGENTYLGVADWPIGEDSWVSTPDWLGWLWVEHHPWVYVFSLGRFIYLDEASFNPSGAAWLFGPTAAPE